MSTYSTESFVQACFEQLRAVDPSIEASVIPRLTTMVPVALRLVAQKVSSSPDRNFRNLLRGPFTINVVGGVGQVTLDSSLRDDIAMRSADIRTADGQKIQMLADRASLDRDLPDSFLFGAMLGTTLYTNAPDGQLSGVGSFVHVDVANMPSQLIPMLFDEMLAAWKARSA